MRKPCSGTVDANGIAHLTITNITSIPIIPGPALTINAVEGVNLADATVATFQSPLTTILPTASGELPASDFTATIDWGDPSTDMAAGTITQDATNPSVYNVTGTHTFVENGTYTVTNTVDFAGGLFSSDVYGVPVTVTLPPSGPTTGNAATANVTSPLSIDTLGPVIDGAFFNRLNGQVDYIIQDPVPASGGAPAGVSVKTLLDSSNYLFYLLTKVHASKAYPRKWVVTDVTATPDPTIPYAYDVAVTFNGGAIIDGGFYLFAIRGSSNGNSSVQDRAENHLDGVFYGSFPSGNGINGSDFVAELQAVHDKVFAPDDQWRPAGRGGAQQNLRAGRPAWPQSDLLDLHQPVQWRPARHRAQDQRQGLRRRQDHSEDEHRKGVTREEKEPPGRAS